MREPTAPRYPPQANHPQQTQPPPGTFRLDYSAQPSPSQRAAFEATVRRLMRPLPGHQTQDHQSETVEALPRQAAQV